MHFTFCGASLYRLLDGVAIVYEFSIYEANQLRRIRPLFAWRSEAREEFKVKDAKHCLRGDRFAVVLEFEFLSRIIAFKQSMNRCRYGSVRPQDHPTRHERGRKPAQHLFTKAIREAP